MTLGCIASYMLLTKWIDENQNRIDTLLDVNEKHRFCCSEFTPLDMAVIVHRRDLMEKLIWRGAKTDNLEFMLVHTSWEWEDVIKYCYQQGEKPGFAVMVAAVREENTVRLNWLLDKGGDINQVDWQDETLFDVAVSRTGVEFVKFLMSRGASLSSRSLSIALNRADGAIDMARFLLEHGAQAREGDSILWLLVGGNLHSKEEKHSLIALLIEFGASPNGTTDEGNTTLIFAAASGAVEIIRLLLRHGADWRLRNKDGLSALDFAEKRNQREVIALLRDVEAGSSTG